MGFTAPRPRIAETSYPDHTPVIPASYHRYSGPNRRRMALSIPERPPNHLFPNTARRLHVPLTAPPDNTSRPDDTKRRLHIASKPEAPQSRQSGRPPYRSAGVYRARALPKQPPRPTRLPSTRRHGAGFVSLRWVKPYPSTMDAPSPARGRTARRRAPRHDSGPRGASRHRSYAFADAALPMTRPLGTGIGRV